MNSRVTRLERGLPWLLASASLLPFLIGYRQFAKLFWFGDELDLIDQFDRTGFWRWTRLPFSENFVPLFKLLWGGLAHVGGGSYLVMLAVVWLTHALNVWLLATWMSRRGFSQPGVLLAALVFGLSDTNIETLGWTVQWSAMLAVTFFLIAALYYDDLSRGEIPPTNRDIMWLGALCTASAWSFARGVLTGAVIAGLALVSISRDRARTMRRVALAVACLTPALVTAALIFLLAARGPHHDIFSGGRWRQALAFATWYAALNPIRDWLNTSPLSWALVVEFGAIKLLAIGLGFVCAKNSQRQLLLTMLLMEMGNTFLLGIGRYGGDLSMATSSRYQYSSLLTTMPFFGAVFGYLVETVPRRYFGRAFFAGGLLVLVVWQSTRLWPWSLENWQYYRGVVARRLLLEQKDVPTGYDVPGIPFLPNQRAKELVIKYHLH